MKSHPFPSRTISSVSHPARGEWIEIISGSEPRKRGRSLTPRGVSGLKSSNRWSKRPYIPSHPARGEWIEIATISGMIPLLIVSPREG